MQKQEPQYCFFFSNFRPRALPASLYIPYIHILLGMLVEQKVNCFLPFFPPLTLFSLPFLRVFPLPTSYTGSRAPGMTERRCHRTARESGAEAGEAAKQSVQLELAAPDCLLRTPQKCHAIRGHFDDVSFGRQESHPFKTSFLTFQLSLVRRPDSWLERFKQVEVPFVERLYGGAPFWLVSRETKRNTFTFWGVPQKSAHPYGLYPKGRRLPYGRHCSGSVGFRTIPPFVLGILSYSDPSA